MELIDSETVFTTLSRFSGRNGNDFYFIDEACKTTFVSKTKKKYGRHIFWLSSEQHKSIGTIDCKPGSEFEIKTDNSLGLMTLPPSRHRVDLKTHYQSIGVDKIERKDRMYALLLDTLKDCLKPKYKKKKANYRVNENFDGTIQVDLKEKEIDFIYQLLVPSYRTGYRHHIIYGLSGLLHKHHITLESAASLIQKLSFNDDERDSRLLTLNDTYQKNPKEVSGYQYLLSALENVVADGQAKDILRKIMNVISAGSNNEDVIINLTTKLMTEFSFKTMRDNEEIYCYDNNVGVYLGFGDSIIREYVEVLQPKIKTYQVNEIVQKIKRRTYVDRDRFDENPDVINVQNGLLNIWTGQLKDHSPDILSVVQLPIVFNTDKKCPNILRFLGQVLHPQDVFTAMEIIGYILYRSAVYEKAMMLYGNGDNGKSVFIRLIEAFVGPQNCSHVPLQELDNDKFSSADLYGKLVNTFADLKSQKLMATGNFKTLVSGDSVRAQRKYGQPFTFRNYSKLIFSSNRIPDSDDKSQAYYKRWSILSFDKVFQGATKDTNLINKLATPDELSGILNLALIALRQLRKDGGFKEISVEKIRKEYNANTIKAFLGEKCVVDLASPEYSTPTVYLYNEYEIFCQAKSARPLDMNVFGAKLKEYGIEKDRIRSHGDREYHYFGVKLISALRGPNRSLFSG
jgi:P4 family phage/plasmid primase-like protien